MRQRSFADLEYANRRRVTRREKFLNFMDETLPWSELTAKLRPFYPSGNRGRPVRGIETMLRMYMLQKWFALSDVGVEDAVYDSYAMRSFLGVDFSGGEQVPDATTLCRFRSLIEDNGLGEYFDAILRRGVEECERQRLRYVANPVDDDDYGAVKTDYKQLNMTDTIKTVKK